MPWIIFIMLEFDFGLISANVRLPGGYTVEWFWGYFYMWCGFGFRCFRDFGNLGWFLGFEIRCWILGFLSRKLLDLDCQVGIR